MHDRAELETLYSFIATLRQRNQELHKSGAAIIPHGQSLAYADALLRHQYMLAHLKDLPAQIAVIGPTQAGKSTLINALLGVDAAEASPLAGFTRHAQGFTSTDLDGHVMALLQSLLPDWKQMPMTALSNDDLSSFSVTAITAQQLGHDDFLLWDTPDFDSVNSRDYRATVPTLCAIADAVVLIVSKEKYADQSVWETLDLISPIQRPLIIVINKTSGDNAMALREAMEKKLAETGIAYAAIITLPYSDKLLSPATLATFEPISELRQLIVTSLEQPVETSTAEIKHWLDHYWNDWLRPVRAETNAVNSWQAIITEEQQATLEIYRRDYLQQPHYAETLNKAIVRLLELLEIPMLASGLTALRQAVTWPARKLGKLIKAQTNIGASDSKADQETTILLESGRHFIQTLENRLLSEQQDASLETVWWQQLATSFTRKKPDFENRIETAIKTHQQAFQPEIDAVANQLYAYLQEHPVTLNSLRTARVGTDAAAVLLAIKTGGLGLSDLALAPAFVAVTSFLTEGAVGQHMRSIESELKERQLASVKDIIFTQELEPAVLQLPLQMSTEQLYGFSEATLEDAESALATLNE